MGIQKSGEELPENFDVKFLIENLLGLEAANQEEKEDAL